MPHLPFDNLLWREFLVLGGIITHHQVSIPVEVVFRHEVEVGPRALLFFESDRGLDLLDLLIVALGNAGQVWHVFEVNRLRPGPRY